MSAIHLSDREIIEQIQAGGQTQERCIEQIFRQFWGLYHKARSQYRTLTPVEIQDVYTDTVLDFRDSILSGRFRGESKCSSYFFRMFSNQCIDRIRKNTTHSKRGVMVDSTFALNIQDANIDIERALIVQEEMEELLGYFAQLGKTCRHVLLDWAYHGYSMQDIAERNHLNNARTAASTRYTCLKCLMRIIDAAKDKEASP